MGSIAVNWVGQGDIVVSTDGGGKNWVGYIMGSSVIGGVWMCWSGFSSGISHVGKGKKDSCRV